MGDVESSFNLRVGMAGMGKNEIKTPREQFPNLVMDFFGPKQPWVRRLVVTGDSN